MFNVNQIADLMRPELLKAIVLGKVDGAGFIRKFALNELLAANTQRDIWDYGSTGWGAIDYTWPADETAPIDTISSSNAADTDPILITGLDINGLQVDQTITLDGLNKVSLSTPLWRCWRAMNVKITTRAVRGEGIAGEVYIYEDTAIVDGVPTDKTKIRAFINDGNNQTLMSQYTVPADKTLLILGGGTYIANRIAASLTADSYFRTYGNVFRRVSVSGLNSVGTGNDFNEEPVPGLAPGKTDIVLTATSSTAGVAASSIYSGLLFDNDKWNLSF